ncbi:hypothetical protein E1176_10000 [Fulvivirga sp. RKSG066]|uniref:hypothetical protein n=1 Tax=Fulvivirga aurantia TaxID=2529383 RepID=UPI0012BBC900|nr:hypothetical protein [Fulvivirga aurantia]MTI21351.1 hypothetical protein [Fulvivirga aurantia]
MKEQDRSNFENSFQEAFASAERAPDAQLWDKVALGVAKNENSGFKKRILFFKLMAAASVAFAAIIGGVYLYDYNFGSVNQYITNSAVVDNDTNKRNESSVQETLSIGQEKNELNKEQGSSQFLANDQGVGARSEHNLSDKNDYESRSKINGNSGNNMRKELAQNGVDFESKNSSGLGDKSDPFFAVSNGENTTSILTKTQPEKVDRKGVILGEDGALLSRELQLVPRLEYLFANQKSFDKMWVGLGVAYGQNFPSSSGQDNAAGLASFDVQGGSVEASQVRLSDESSGGVMTAGVTVGKQLSKRWILEGGLNYVGRSTFVESNLKVANNLRGEAVNDIESLAQEDRLELTNTYELKNNYHSVAVPIQAGFFLVDRQFDVVLKGGISNEILLLNRVEDTSGDLKSRSIKTGENSPYNTYILSGVLSSEFSYAFDENYYLSLTPQVMKSFNSIKDSDASGESKPLVFTLGFRLGYLID